MRVIGVDFSGDKSEGSKITWFAEGNLSGGGLLKLEICCPITRKDLTHKLASLKQPAVVAMDFPFSVPREFANFWVPTARTMPDLWAATQRDSFSTRRDEFVRLRWEQKRTCDPPESKSPLKRHNPDMGPMTIWGMRMLDCLWHCRTVSVSVLPLPESSPHGSGHPVKLLEVMPGATLRSLKLPYTGYKAKDRIEKRQEILNKLPNLAQQVASVQVVGLSAKGDIYKKCEESDDALDSVIAAITAALWVYAPDRFPHPPAPGQPGHQVSLLEGWLFKPYQINEPAEEQE